MNANIHNLINKLIFKQITISVAESCTGGMICKMITDVPGASMCFLGGCVTYSNQSKMDLIGVRDETLVAHGAVSIETAAEMAVGIRDLMGSDIGISVTGIAGPGGGSNAKPVGTVCFGLAHSGGCITHKELFAGNRDQIRIQATDYALCMLLSQLCSG